MNRYVALISAAAICFSVVDKAPTLAKEINKNHHGKYMSSHKMMRHHSSVPESDQKLSSPIAQDAEEAIIWQNSLHGEIN